MYRASNSWWRGALAMVLAASLPVFTADLYVIDGGSGKTRAAADWNDSAHWLDQSNTTLQCALPAVHADFANQLCLTFSSATPNWYASNRAASLWRDPHNGVGNQPVIVWTPLGTGRPLGTRATGGGPIGFVISCDGAPNLASFFGNGTTNLSLAPGAGGATSGTPTYARTQLLGTTGRLWSKGTLISTVGSYTPSASDPVGTLTWGAAPAGANPHSMRSPMVAIWPPSMSAEILQQHINQYYGLAP